MACVHKILVCGKVFLMTSGSFGRRGRFVDSNIFGHFVLRDTRAIALLVSKSF